MKLFTALTQLCEAKTASLIANTRAGQASAERKAEAELADRIRQVEVTQSTYAYDQLRLEQARRYRSNLIEMQRIALAKASAEIDMLSMAASQSRKELENAEDRLRAYGS